MRQEAAVTDFVCPASKQAFHGRSSSARSRRMQQGMGECLALPFALMRMTVDEKGGGTLYQA